MNSFFKKSPLKTTPLALLALVAAFATTQAIAQTANGTKNSRFFEVSYGSTTSGHLTSEPFSAYGLEGLTATIQYRATPFVEIEFGVRKAWGLPVDVSVSATQMRTPLHSYTTSLSPAPQSLDQRGITNIYSVNAYYDMLTRRDWNLFLGAGLGWADLVDADSNGASVSLSTGARYQFQSGLYGLLKFKVATVPKSKATVGGQQLTLASQVMPMLSLGIGFDF